MNATADFGLIEAASSLAAFFLVHMVVVATPGPAFFAVTRVAVSSSRQAGLIAAIAMTLGALAWGLATLLGLHVLFEKAPWLYNAMRLGGAAYLIYMGIGMLRAGWRGDRAAAAKATVAAGRSTFLNCLGVQLSNPKAAVYFGSVFVTLLPEAAPLWFKATALALMGCMEFGWYALVAMVLSVPKARAVYASAKRALDLVFGGILTGLGIKLALSR
jgi:threonine/homoserine/homoserine lactone efflux protein